MYTFGKITLTKQALGVFITGVILTLLVFFTSVRALGARTAVPLTLLTFATVSYNTYLTNCTVVGKCEQLAWFLVAMNALLVVMTALSGKMFGISLRR